MCKQHYQNTENKRKQLLELLPRKLLPSVALYSRLSRRKIRKDVQNKHKAKMENLAKEQERPLFDIHDTVKRLNIDVKPPQYVVDTLALGAKNSIRDRFNHYDMLAELDLALKKCQRMDINNDKINDINILTIKYIKACKLQMMPRNIKL